MFHMSEVVPFHQRVTPLEKDSKVWSCWSECSLIEGSMSLGVGFKVSKAQASLVALSSCCLRIWMKNTQLLLQRHVSLHACTFPVVMIMD